MKQRKPPSLAVWILTWLSGTPENEPLAGDLIETFQGGKSILWFLRQTAAAVFTAFARRTRIRRFLLQALFIGSAAQTAVFFTLWNLPERFIVTGIVCSAGLLACEMVAFHFGVKRKFREWVSRDNVTFHEFEGLAYRVACLQYGSFYIITVNMTCCGLMLALDWWVLPRIGISIHSVSQFVALQLAMLVAELWGVLNSSPLSQV